MQFITADNAPATETQDFGPALDGDTLKATIGHTFVVQVFGREFRKTANTTPAEEAAQKPNAIRVNAVDLDTEVVYTDTLIFGNVFQDRLTQYAGGQEGAFVIVTTQLQGSGRKYVAPVLAAGAAAQKATAFFTKNPEPFTKVDAPAPAAGQDPWAV